MGNSLLTQIIKSDDTYMPLISLIIYMVLWSDINRREMMLLVYLVISIVFTAITNVMAFYHINNLALYHFYTLFETVFLSYYIIRQTAGKINLRWFVPGVAVFFGFWLLNILMWEPLNVYNSNSSCLSYLVVIACCMYYMLELAKSDKILNFQKQPSFWIVSSFFVFSAASILVVAVYRYYISLNILDEARSVFRIIHLANVTKFIMLSVGLLCYKRQSSQQLLLL